MSRQTRSPRSPATPRRSKEESSARRAKAVAALSQAIGRAKKPGESLPSFFQRTIDVLCRRARMIDKTDPELAGVIRQRADNTYRAFCWVQSSRKVHGDACQIPIADGRDAGVHDAVDIEDTAHESDWRETRALPVPRRIRRPTYEGVGGCVFLPTPQPVPIPADIASRITSALALASHLWDSIPDCPVTGSSRADRFKRVRQLRSYAAALGSVSDSDITPPRAGLARLIAPARLDQLQAPSAKLAAVQTAERMAQIRPLQPRKKIHADKRAKNAAASAAYRARQLASKLMGK